MKKSDSRVTRSEKEEKIKMRAKRKLIIYCANYFRSSLAEIRLMSLLSPCRSRNTSRLRFYRVNNRSRSWAKVLMASRVAGDGISLAPTANRSLLLPPSHRHRPPFDVVEAVSGSPIDVNQHGTVRPGYFIQVPRSKDEILKELRFRSWHEERVFMKLKMCERCIFFVSTICIGLIEIYLLSISI